MKIKLFVCILTVLLLIVGCSANNENTGDPVNDTKNETEEQGIVEEGNETSNQPDTELNTEDNTSNETDTDTTQNNGQATEKQENTQPQPEQNKELTTKVKEEKGVLDGQVYTQDDTAIGTLVIDKSVSDADAKNLAEKYADELKKVYKDMKVNVQAVRDGENVANITKE